MFKSRRKFWEHTMQTFKGSARFAIAFCLFCLVLFGLFGCASSISTDALNSAAEEGSGNTVDTNAADTDASGLEEADGMLKPIDTTDTSGLSGAGFQDTGSNTADDPYLSGIVAQKASNMGPYLETGSDGNPTIDLLDFIYSCYPDLEGNVDIQYSKSFFKMSCGEGSEYRILSFDLYSVNYSFVSEATGSDTYHTETYTLQTNYSSDGQSVYNFFPHIDVYLGGSYWDTERSYNTVVIFCDVLDYFVSGLDADPFDEYAEVYTVSVTQADDYTP